MLFKRPYPKSNYDVELPIRRADAVNVWWCNTDLATPCSPIYKPRQLDEEEFIYKPGAYEIDIRSILEDCSPAVIALCGLSDSPNEVDTSFEVYATPHAEASQTICCSSDSTETLDSEPAFTLKSVIVSPRSPLFTPDSAAADLSSPFRASQSTVSSPNIPELKLAHDDDDIRSQGSSVLAPVTAVAQKTTLPYSLPVHAIDADFLLRTTRKAATPRLVEDNNPPCTPYNRSTNPPPIKHAPPDTNSKRSGLRVAESNKRVSKMHPAVKTSKQPCLPMASSSSQCTQEKSSPSTSQSTFLVNANDQPREYPPKCYPRFTSSGPNYTPANEVLADRTRYPLPQKRTNPSNSAHNATSSGNTPPSLPASQGSNTGTRKKRTRAVHGEETCSAFIATTSSNATSSGNTPPSLPASQNSNTGTRKKRKRVVRDEETCAAFITTTSLDTPPSRGTAAAETSNSLAKVGADTAETKLCKTAMATGKRQRRLR
ncbi:hypothetical protein AX17_004818 [Amanita inopinata Kibby_2008]|nr:hypothetical protein AX17_004818 [Amanita inopinata Kibby_2008]